jgi:adhesin HecA-like repeat protein
MGKEAQSLWAERTVRAVNRAFPDVEFSNWHLCGTLIPHAIACAGSIKYRGFEFEEAARLLNQAGFYQYEHALYAEAEPLYTRALEIREKSLGKDHPNVAASLNNLAGLYDAQGRYDEAEPLYKRALEILEKSLGEKHPGTVTVSENLAALLQKMRD